MAASHFTKSSVATMVIHTACLFAGLFNIPASASMTLISKLWQLKPTMALYYGTFCNYFRYGSLNNVEVSLILYVGAIVVLNDPPKMVHRSTKSFYSMLEHQQ